MLRKYWIKGDLAAWQEQIASLCYWKLSLDVCREPGIHRSDLAIHEGTEIGGISDLGRLAKPARQLPRWWPVQSGVVIKPKDAETRDLWRAGTRRRARLSKPPLLTTILCSFSTRRNSPGTDEQQRARTVIEVTFKLAEQTEKERMHQSSGRAWRCFFLSTSNQSIRQLGDAGGVVVDDATVGRLADIPLPSGGHGIYEQLHGFASGKVLSDALQSRTRQIFGVAAREFVREVLTERRKDENQLRRFLRSRREAYLKKLQDTAKDKNLRHLHRVSDRFATVYAAGSLAIRSKILPWKRKDLLRAILSCEVDQLQTVHRPVQDASVEDLRQKLVQYMGAHRKQFLDFER